MDSGKYNDLSLEECVDEDSTIDISSGSHEVEPQHDNVHESGNLEGQLRVMMAWDSLNGESSIDEFQTLRERVNVMRNDYQRLLMDRDYLLEVSTIYHGTLKEKETEVGRFTHELVGTHGLLKGTQTVLQESESILEDPLEEAIQGSTIVISTKSLLRPNIGSLPLNWDILH
jgi:hypothetical protein